MATINAAAGKLLGMPYVGGYTPSNEDAQLFNELFGNNNTVVQWAAAMASYYQAERQEIKTGTAAGGGAAAGPAPKAAAKPAAKPSAASAPAVGSAGGGAVGDDDDVDLFGDDTEDDVAARAATAAAKKANKPPPKSQKSTILMDIKGWDDETDLNALVDKLKSNEIDGLVWGAHKLEPVAYGMSKLRIMIVIEDDKVSAQDIDDLLESYEDDIQSHDVVAWNKV